MKSAIFVFIVLVIIVALATIVSSIDWDTISLSVPSIDWGAIGQNPLYIVIGIVGTVIGIAAAIIKILEFFRPKNGADSKEIAPNEHYRHFV
jgi:hypothetical protein